MNYKLADLAGFGPEFTARLAAAGVLTTHDLLRACTDPPRLQSLTRDTGLGESVLRRWAQMADLMRAKGIGTQYAEMLLAVGVPSLEALIAENPEVLARRLETLNRREPMTGALPRPSEIGRWIEDARRYEPVHVN